MRAVNLLPRDAQSGGKSIRNEDPAVVIGSVLGVVVIVVMSVGFLVAHSKVSAEQKKLTAAQVQLGALSLHKQPTAKTKTAKPTRPIIPLPAVTSEEQPLLAEISTAMSSRIAWDRILREFSLVMPDDVTISALTMTAPTASAPTQGLTISGLAFSQDSVARLLSRLMLIPDLSDINLTNSTGGAAAGVQFSITATVKGAPAPAPTPAVPTTPADTTDTSGGSS
jgi:Tfp pilus assembly protein PilN